MGKYERAEEAAAARGEKFIWPAQQRKTEQRRNLRASKGRSRVDGDAPRSGSIEVVLEPGVPAPSCEHGPCLLFERYRENGVMESFWACAVYRDRKHCRFYLPLGQELKAAARKEIRGLVPKRRKHLDALRRLKAFRRRNYRDRKFCVDCTRLLSAEEEPEHAAHRLETGVTKAQLLNPTTLLAPITHKDKESQYWFSSKCCAFLWDAVVAAGFDSVLCIGAPRLFETLQGRGVHAASESGKPVRSFLMDLDDRYKEFWAPKKFAHFSMFANHLYDAKLGNKCLDMFLKDAKKLLIFVDPPFGGILSPLVRSLHSLVRRHSTLSPEGESKLMLVAPYFLEGKIRESEPGLKMLDYQVDYDNHRKFRASGSKHGSPVRLFTTLARGAVALPETEGYRFCADCGHHVAAVARHCAKCRACVAKSGEEYRHCGPCKMCVKAKYTHCKKCKRCHAADAACRRAPTCSICEAKDHKRKDCPKKAALKDESPMEED